MITEGRKQAILVLATTFLDTLQSVEEVEFAAKVLRQRWYRLDAEEGERVKAALRRGDRVRWGEHTGVIEKFNPSSIVVRVDGERNVADDAVRVRVNPRILKLTGKSRKGPS